MKKIEPNPNHPAFIKGKNSALRGVVNPRTRFPRDKNYRENFWQFKYGRLSILNQLYTEVEGKCVVKAYAPTAAAVMLREHELNKFGMI